MRRAQAWRRLLRRIAGDPRGVTIVEFAIVAPVMAVLMMGLGDLLHQFYAKALLNGAMQKAARDSALQSGAGSSDALDAGVMQMVTGIVKAPTKSCATTPVAGTWCSTRQSYSTFSNVAPEPFIDTNKNGKRDPGECYTDVNGNKQWDADPGIGGQGGADDVTLYTFSITYQRLFPVAGLIGWSNTATITSQTLLKNQPYDAQKIAAPGTICT